MFYAAQGVLLGLYQKNRSARNAMLAVRTPADSTGIAAHMIVCRQDICAGFFSRSSAMRPERNSGASRPFPAAAARPSRYAAPVESEMCHALARCPVAADVVADAELMPGTIRLGDNLIDERNNRPAHFRVANTHVRGHQRDAI